MGVLASRHDVLLLDLDGVVYQGENPIPHAIDALGEVQRSGTRLAFVTNNASRPPSSVSDQLHGLGLSVGPADIVTSAQAGARVLAGMVPPGSKVLVVGGQGLFEAVSERGFVAVEDAADEPVAVIQGFSKDVGWRRLAQATFALRAGAVYVATNTDLTIPTDGGMAPGNGLLVSVVARASGVEPVVAGKPEPPLMNESVERTGAVAPLVVGDRLDTDIAGAVRSGIPSLLVLTGVTGVRELLAAGPEERPTYVSADLRGLLRAPLAPGDAGDSWVAELGRAAAVAWQRADAGTPLGASEIEAVADRLGPMPQD